MPINRSTLSPYWIVCYNRDESVSYKRTGYKKSAFHSAPILPLFGGFFFEYISFGTSTDLNISETPFPRLYLTLCDIVPETADRVFHRHFVCHIPQ